ncbi:hypothetical protein B0A58_09180 [Flavobacterium branchiophilum NBRC 15030 = ATCC 35035]|nr:hypothetical protein B0A58_09180 [Flavobacterium branchiophilum NBRC 15030 = ATCC 35035]
MLSSSSITNFDISNHPNIETLIFRNIYSGSLSNLNVLGCNNLKELWVQENHFLGSLNLTGLQNLEILNAQYYGWSGNYQNSLLNSIDLLGCTSLKEINVSKASLSSIDLQSCLNLEKLICDNNTNLTTLNLSGLSLFGSLVSNNCSLNNLNLSNCTSLQTLQCQNNQLTTLDLSDCGNLQSVNCDNNNLQFISFKNNTNETKTFLNNPNLTYICADDMEQQSVQYIVNVYEMWDTCVVGDYCSFNPNGNYNTISGNALYDNETNGCDTNDAPFEFLRVNMTDGTNSGSTFTNFEGDYAFFMNNGTFTLTPQLENPTYFNVSPATTQIAFANNNNNTASQDFCITPNGTHNDLEVVLAQVTPARPGFDAEYRLVYKNKGNQPLSGAVSVTFDDAKSDFVSASVVPTSNTTGSLSWNYSNLLPFENRSISFTLNVNTPTETPAVNNGDILAFNAQITPLTGDEVPADNVFVYNQTVVGSFDPNDIYCLEGSSLDPSMIGNYLHYNVRFENTGTAAAENIVVATTINPAEYDLSSLQVMNASHNVYTRLNGNLVEFIFENIQLAGSPSGGHGHVLFKMKSNPNVQTTGHVTSNANIFFDYNFPVPTNDATTVFETLQNRNFTKDTTVTIAPNPAEDSVTLSAQSNINAITIFDAQGRIVQFIKADSLQKTIDVNHLKTGMYILEIQTETGKKVEKLMKK